MSQNHVDNVSSELQVQEYTEPVPAAQRISEETNALSIDPVVIGAQIEDVAAADPPSPNALLNISTAEVNLDEDVASSESTTSTDIETPPQLVTTVREDQHTQSVPANVVAATHISGTRNGHNGLQARSSAQSQAVKVTENGFLIDKVLIWSTVIMALPTVFAVTYLGWTAGDVFKPGLVRVSYTSGVLILSILSKTTDYVLAAAAQSAWTEVLWGQLLGGPSRPVWLTRVLVMTTSWGGWARILIFGWWPNLLGGGKHTKKLEGYPRLWTVGRILIWGLLQFPGLVIMSLVNLQTSYQPVYWNTTTTGGLGIYDPTLVEPLNLPFIFSYITGILKDQTKASTVDPITPDCQQAGLNCAAYLLSGGLTTVTPWPFRFENDSSLTAYMVQNAPAYQLDIWTTPPGNITWATNACKIYASEPDKAFQFCSSLYGNGGESIVTGWRPCLNTLLPSGDCSTTDLAPEGWNSFYFKANFMAIYRRSASFSASRSTGEIYRIDDLGPATLQRIDPLDFTAAFDSFFWPWDNGNYPQLCDNGGQRVRLTEFIWTILCASGLQYGANSAPLDYLSNLYGTALYLFNPVVNLFGIGNASITFSLDSSQQGLPPENNVKGSMARVLNHAGLTLWTVYAYFAIAISIILMVIVVVSLTGGKAITKASVFPLVDFLSLSVIGTQNDTTGINGRNTMDNTQDESNTQTGQENRPRDLREIFTNHTRGEDMEILNIAARIQVIIDERRIRFNEETRV